MNGAPDPPREVTPVMQRVRVGLTGLACVFLLVQLAASLFGLAGEGPEDPVPTDMANNAVAAAPREPLAELGVAPGNAPEATANTAQPPAPAAAR
jgi:hypothetical protein